MKKWEKELNRDFSREEIQMPQKTHQEMLNNPNHKGNGNQNHVKILPYSC
jgi:hypothetical protein